MGLGTTEILIIAGVLILLFGAKKLPDLAQGMGKALNIFKRETKGLMNDDDNPNADPHGRPLPPSAQTSQQISPPASSSQQQPQDGQPRDQQY